MSSGEPDRSEKGILFGLVVAGSAGGATMAVLSRPAPPGGSGAQALARTAMAAARGAAMGAGLALWGIAGAAMAAGAVRQIRRP